MLSNSEVLVNTLIELGARHFFMIAGGNAMYLNEAVRKSNVKFTVFHHEQAAGMAAEAYSRLTREISVCLVTSGPGASNLLTGVAGAFLDSAPVIYIAGQSKFLDQVTTAMSEGVRQVGTFELPMVEIMKPVTKESLQFNLSTNVFEETNRLVTLALEGRPGPIFIEMPLDVQALPSTKVSASNYHKSGIKNEGCRGSAINFLKTLSESLAQAKRPLLLVGHGVSTSGNSKTLLSFAETLNIPIVTTQLAKDFVPYQHPLFVGHIGLRGDRPGNIALSECDLLVVIGSSLHQQTIGYDPEFFAQSAIKFLIELSGSVSSKNLPIDFKAWIDIEISDFLREVNSTSFAQTSFWIDSEKWIAMNQSRKTELAVVNEPHTCAPIGLNMYHFVDALSNQSQNGDVIITDAGLSFYVMGQAFKVKPSQRYIVSGGLGSMGYSLPAAIGVALGGATRTIAVTGDGSFMMNMQDLATMVSKNLNINLFILNNNGYSSIRNTQKSFFNSGLIGVSAESGLSFPNFKKIAESFGCSYIRVESLGNLDNELKEILNSVGPKFIEVICLENQTIMPTVSSTRNPEGILVSNKLHEMSPKIDDGTSARDFN